MLNSSLKAEWRINLFELSLPTFDLSGRRDVCREISDLRWGHDASADSL